MHNCGLLLKTQLARREPGTQVQVCNCDRLLVDFLAAELEHALARLGDSGVVSQPDRYERSVADALLTFEVARHFQVGIEDPAAQWAIHTRADELQRRTASPE